MEEGDGGRGGGSSEDEERTTSQRSKFCTPARRATRRRVRPCAPLVRQQTCPALHLQGFTAEEAEEEEEEEEEEVIFPPRSLARLGPVRRGGRARRREVRSLSGRSAGAAPGGPRQAGPPPSRDPRPKLSRTRRTSLHFYVSSSPYLCKGSDNTRRITMTRKTRATITP
ncbi:unnamed protein product [Prorocentrum cordatum]|uniref:Uncharacterized protein n=1 Tax=Prorocentrum cordatum TaxID=2364126 RepID=A0ABN9R580_9DINO|nr:unnamed protein product [Polarella glacialis]